MTIENKKGKHYKTRSGYKVEIIAYNANSYQPFIAWVFLPSGRINACYSTEGEYILHKESPMDVVGVWEG